MFLVQMPLDLFSNCLEMKNPISMINQNLIHRHIYHVVNIM